VDDPFCNLLKKHRRPIVLKEMLRERLVSGRPMTTSLLASGGSPELAGPVVQLQCGATPSQGTFSSLRRLKAT
jgi:hypothetical protein